MTAFQGKTDGKISILQSPKLSIEAPDSIKC
jgi:hypothetical protein